MRKQTLLWTSLPAGRTADRRLRLSVLVSPRLHSDDAAPQTTLAQFPDLARWGAQPPRFAVRFAERDPVEATVVSAPPRTDLWEALLPPDTPVRSYRFKRLDGRTIHSFPIKRVLAYLRGQYEAIGGAHPQEMPGAAAYTGLSHVLGGPALPPDAGDLQESVRRAFALTSEFQAQLPWVQGPEPGGARDFHQVVAGLGQYPSVMRVVGLVFDLEVAAEGVPAEGGVAVVPLWQPQLAESLDLTPVTRYVLDDQRFQAAPRPRAPELADGLLRLSDPAFGMVQVDVDSTALRVGQLAQAVTPLRRNRSQSAAVPFALPALASQGITVFQSGRGERVRQALSEAADKGQALEAGEQVELYAEELLRGYRVDVWDAWSGQWHSLCRRVGRYRFGHSLVLTTEDEGYVPAGLTFGDAEDGDLFVHEELFTWDGWSLVAPRPGAPRQESAPAAPPPASRLQASFVPAPRSLPRLRFGGIYRLRARAVDLAGNSLPLESGSADDFSHATAPATYGRFDPVASPILVLRAPPGPGESATHVVIRSDGGGPCDVSAERHVAPPPAEAGTAQGHGKLDPASQPPAELTAEPFAPDAVHAESTLAVTYLPDPLARGVAIRGLPGVPGGDIYRVEFGTGPWPESLPFRLRLQEGTGAPTWDEAARVLTVYLAQAETARVRISCCLHPNDLLEMGIWQWLEHSRLPAARVAQLRRWVTEGRHWMLTPYRAATLVHAVRQPLAAPEFTQLTVGRTAGHSYAGLVDRVSVHGRSTGSIAVEAAWDEPVDDPDTPGWRTVPHRVLLPAVAVSPAESAVMLKVRQEFGDTRHHHVRYGLVGTSRFAEYFGPTPEAPVTRASTRNVTGEVLSAARPAAPKVLYAEAADGRAGGWRLWLERPWFSSGAGELLGVVLAPGGRAGARYTTQWGLDLAWRSAGGFPPPTPAHFQGPVAAAIGLTLREAPGMPVVVAGQAVTYDPVRQLWYSDLVPGTGGLAFVRLALVRYQPHSVAGLHLSEVVMADVARLPGNHLLTVLVGPTNRDLTLAVTGSGGDATTAWTARVERYRDGAWVAPVPETFALEATEDPQWPAQAWTGTVPLGAPAEAGPWRVVLEAIAETDVVLPARPGGTATRPTGRRVVHRAVVEG